MHGEYKVPGGKLVVVDLDLDLELEGGRIAQVQVSGDFFLEPDTALEAINAAVRGLPADADAARISAAVQAGLDTLLHPLAAVQHAMHVHHFGDAANFRPGQHSSHFRAGEIRAGHLQPRR